MMHRWWKNTEDPSLVSIWEEESLETGGEAPAPTPPWASPDRLCLPHSMFVTGACHTSNFDGGAEVETTEMNCEIGIYGAFELLKENG